MSDENKLPTGRGYSLARSKFTIDDIKDLKRLFADDPLAFWIRMAGAGGIAGIILVLIEVVRGIIDLVKHYR
jgi:hypothetical protein